MSKIRYRIQCLRWAIIRMLGGVPKIESWDAFQRGRLAGLMEAHNIVSRIRSYNLGRKAFEECAREIDEHIEICENQINTRESA